MLNKLEYTVHEFVEMLSGFPEYHEDHKQAVERALEESFGHIDDMGKINVYNMGGHKELYEAGTDKRFNIFLDCSPHLESEKKRMNIVLYHDAFEVDIFESFSDYERKYIELKDERETTLAVYEIRTGDLYVLYDVCNFGDPDETYRHLKFIFDKLVEYAHCKPKNADSWDKTNDRERLEHILKNESNHDMKQEVRRLEAEVDGCEGNIRFYRSKLIEMSRELIAARRKLEGLRSHEGDDGKAIIEQMDLIAKHPKVTDVLIHKDNFTVEIPDIHAYDSEGKRYYIGDFQINIAYSQSRITFNNLNNRRRSFWSSSDHHPHIGETGEACFGNLEETIAELSAQRQLYALVLSLIDFLETVNEDDNAGAYIKNWPVVDDDEREEEAHLEEYEQEPIEEETEFVTCHYSGQKTPKHEARKVYLDFNEETLTPFREVYVQQRFMSNFNYWASVDAFVDVERHERKYFGEDDKPYNEEETVIDHEGYNIPKTFAVRAWDEYTHEGGLKYPVWVFSKEIEVKYHYWKPLGEWVNAMDQADYDFFNDDGKPIDADRDPWIGELKPTPDRMPEE